LEKLAMKKSLIALATLAATGAFAQSSVQIDGNFDAGYQAIDYKGTKVTGFAGNGSSTSGLNFRGTEDLGGGLKANFRLETNFNAASNGANTGVASSVNASTAANANNSVAGTFGNGEIRVGLSGAFGAVDLGAPNMNGLTTFVTGQPFGTAIGGGYASVTRVNAAGNAVRDDNAIKYMSPSFSGLTVSLYKSNKQTKANNSTASTTTGIVTQQTTFSGALGAYDKLGSQELGINYANGPIAASFSSLKQDSVGVAAGTTESTVNTLGANYTMGAAKLFLLNQTNKATGSGAATDTSFTSVSASYTMGATTLMAQMGSLKANAGTNNGKKSDLVGLGADYALSKRTTAYARYESIDDQAGVIAAAGTIDGTAKKRTRTAIGVRHSF
jgi:predicted porin